MAAAAAFLSTYLESVEVLPGELAHHLSRLCEVDVKTQRLISELKAVCELSREVSTEEEKKRLISKLQRNLYQLRRVGDDKGVISSNLQETAEDHLRRLETSAKNFEKARVFEEPLIRPFQPTSAPTRAEPPATAFADTNGDKIRKMENSTTISSNNRAGNKRAREEEYKEVKLKEQITRVPSKKKVKVKKTTKQSIFKEPPHQQQGTQQASSNNLGLPASTPVPDFTTEPIDPNEPTYCLCNQVSFGEMIGCDNEECSIEWFHFQCVGLTSKPKGKWYCPICRQDFKPSKSTKQ